MPPLLLEEPPRARRGVDHARQSHQRDDYRDQGGLPPSFSNRSREELRQGLEVTSAAGQQLRE
eukprot:13750785-Alexandrium_andersonii.AAC.1